MEGRHWRVGGRGGLEMPDLDGEQAGCGVIRVSEGTQRRQECLFVFSFFIRYCHLTLIHGIPTFSYWTSPRNSDIICYLKDLHEFFLDHNLHAVSPYSPNFISMRFHLFWPVVLPDKSCPIKLSLSLLLLLYSVQQFISC